MKKLLIAACCCLVFSSCFLPSTSKKGEKTKKVNYTTQNINNLYSVNIPDFMKPSKKLNDMASLQYADFFKPLFIIVINEDKAETEQVFKEYDFDDIISPDLEGYANFNINSYKEAMEVRHQSDLKDTIINGLKAKTTVMEVNIDGISIYLTYTFIEGTNNYYQLMAWTKTTQKNRYQELIDSMIYSFQEIKNQNLNLITNP